MKNAQDLQNLLIELEFEQVSEYCFVHKVHFLAIVLVFEYKLDYGLKALVHYRVIYIDIDKYIKKFDILKSRILSLLGNNSRIFARKTTLKRIDKAIAKPFLEENHLLGYATVYYKYGLYENEKLVAVALFSKSILLKYENPPVKSYQLVRYASLCGVNIVGGISKFLHYFKSEHNAKHIMTYTDKTWGDTNSYSKLGFNKIKYLSEEEELNPFNYERWIYYS